MTPLTQKRVKNPKNTSIMDHILLENHNAKYVDFSFHIPENNEFQSHRKKSLFIKRDKSELRRNIYTSLKAFCVMIISYWNVYISIILIIIWLTKDRTKRPGGL